MKYLQVTILTLLGFTIQAQDKLTIDNAVLLALEHNFDIQRVENNLAIAENNKGVFISGYLPTLSASGGWSDQINNTYALLKDESVIDFKGTETINLNGAVSLNYVLFNGFNRKNQAATLASLYSMADVQKTEMIDNVLFDVYSNYYNLARSQVRKEILEEAYEISKERLIRAQYQFEYGQTSNLDVLNAQVDANNDSLQMINLNVSIENLARNLNFLIGQNINNPIVVDQEILIDESLQYNDIKIKMEAYNKQLEQLELNQEITSNSLNINKSNYLPTISAQARYNVNNTNFDESNLFYQTQNVNGLNLGLNLSWNIFDGGKTHTQIQNSKIDLLNLENNKKQIELNIQNQLTTTWANYQFQLATILSQELTVDLSEQNFLRTEEKFNLGQITSIEFRQAQLNFINAKMNLTQAEFDAKLTELQLKLFSGELRNL